MRSCKLLRTFLLSIMVVAQFISCVDLAHNALPSFYAGSITEDQLAASDNCVAFASATPIPEKLDCPHEPPTRRRVLLAAHSLPLRDVRSPANSDLQVSMPKFALAQCAERARISSWLYKDRVHDEAIKSDPLWLRFRSLLI